MTVAADRRRPGPPRKRKIRHPGPIVATKQYPHGTNARYSLNFCRCDDCTTAHRAYEQSRKLYQGEFPRVPPPLVDRGPARRHVKKLMARGMSHKRIAQIAGVPASVVGTLVYGRYDRAAKKIRRQTAEKLLAVQYTASGIMKVPATEALAIIDELLARGWWKVEIARRIAGPQAQALQVARTGSGMVEAGTILKLRVLLDEEVPIRQHSNGTFYVPKGRPPRPVPQMTEGMYTAEARTSQFEAAVATVAARREELLGRARLRCKVCDRPLAFHSITTRCA